jgi:RpiR family transcriptional regulator, carbohydrate utilization regulator
MTIRTTLHPSNLPPAYVGRRPPPHLQTDPRPNVTVSPYASQALSLLANLRSTLASLTPTDRRIADCVLANPETILTSPIAHLSTQSHTSVGSIVAFCRHLGLKGFADFKLALATDLAHAIPAPAEHADHSMFTELFQSLTDTLRLNTQHAFERSAQMLQSAQRIEVFSISQSYLMAYIAYRQFVVLGLPASIEADAHLQLIKATQLKSGDVAFGISAAGTTSETVQCLELAKSRGAAALCITNALKSPITAYSDVCLFASGTDTEHRETTLVPRMTQLAVIDALLRCLRAPAEPDLAGRR